MVIAIRERNNRSESASHGLVMVIRECLAASGGVCRLDDG